MEKKEFDKWLNLRIDQETSKMLHELSVLDDRSMSATVRYLIRKEHGKRQTTDKPEHEYAAD